MSLSEVEMGNPQQKCYKGSHNHGARCLVTANSRWRVLFIVACMVATLAIVGTSFSMLPALAANEPTGFKNVVLSVYPEYDDPLGLGAPTVLVMLDGQIEGAAPPATVRFLVPKGAIVYSAGSGPRENYVGGPPNREASDIDGWDEISYELETSYFVVEYYAPIQTSPQKAFSVEFIPLYPIAGLVAVVQQPRQATDFSVVTQSPPVAQERSTDAQGFNVQLYSYDTLKSNQSVSFSISYTKKNPAPSLQIAEHASNKGLIAAAVIAGVLLSGGALYLVRRKASSDRRNRDRVSGKPRTTTSVGARFCKECGARLDESQRFCRKCGTRQSGK